MLLFFFDSMLNLPHRNFEITRVFIQLLWANVVMLNNQILEHITGSKGTGKRATKNIQLVLQELNSDVTRFASHIKLVLQQISLLLVAKSCCRKYRLVLLFAAKSVHHLRVLPAQGKLVWQKVKKLPCIAWLPRNFNQSEVSIHATCKNLICRKTGLNVGSKTRNISFQLVGKQVTRFCCPLYRPLRMSKRVNDVKHAKLPASTRPNATAFARSLT